MPTTSSTVTSAIGDAKDAAIAYDLFIGPTLMVFNPNPGGPLDILTGGLFTLAQTVVTSIAAIMTVDWAIGNIDIYNKDYRGSFVIDYSQQ